MKKNNLLTCLFLFIGIVAGKAQIIATYAGNGTVGYSGDGGAATSAEFHDPGGLTYFVGNLYISDLDNSRIRMVNASGIISTFAGDGTAGYSGDGGAATSAEINTPKGLAADDSGNIYIADEANNRIRKVNTSGIISTYAGNGTAGYSGDGGAATSAKLDGPYGIAIDASGNLYIADALNNRVRKVNTSGTISTIAGNGTAGYSGDGGAAMSAELNHPINVSVDASGNIYIIDYSNNRIRMVNTSGIISTIVGNGTAGFSGDGGAATSAEIDMSTGIAKMDGYGNLYIADDGNNRIRMVNTSGIINTVAGTGTAGYSGNGGLATSAELHSPDHIEFDNVGNYYISDAGNNRVRIIYLPLKVSTNIITNVTCHNANNGAVSALPSGGTTPYTYSWSNSVTYDTNAGLSIGTYSITLTDHYGVTATASATITQPTALSVSASVTTNISCNGENNSSASATPSGGMSPYTYYWSNADTGATISGLSAGTYWVTILANNGCLDTVSASVTITQPMALRDSIASSANTCPQNNNGTVTIGVKYGTSPYTYSWIPGGQTTTTVSGLSAGHYTVVITDHHSCIDSLPVTISTIAATTITARPGIICPSMNDTLNASTATSYAWSTGATTSRIIVSPSISTTYTLESVNWGCHDTAHYIVLTDCGNSCSNASILTTGAFYMSDSLTANASKWYSFVDTASSLPIIVKSVTGSVGNIHKIVLYSSCGGSIIAQDSVSGSSDSLSIAPSSLTSGHTYYLLVNNYSQKTEYTVTDNPKYSANLPIIHSSISISNCGINYTYCSLPLHGRYDCENYPAERAIPYPSPNVFSITIPPGATVQKAYVLYSVIDVSGTYTPQVSVNSVPYTASLTGSNGESTCWNSQYGSCTCGSSDCTNYPYNYAYAGSPNGNVFGYYNSGNGNYRAYMADVTPSVTGSGNYTIGGAGLPVYNRTAGNSPSNCSDVNGATLLVVYQDPHATYIGTFNFGTYSYEANTSQIFTLGIPTPPAGANNGSAFFILDDEQYTDDQYSIYLANSLPPPPSNYTTGNPSLWNTDEISIPTFNCSTIYYNAVTDPEDCYNFVGAGAYYQVPDPSNIILSASPSDMICPGTSVTLTISNPVAGDNYLWSNGATGTVTTVSPTNCSQAYSVVSTTNGNCSQATYTADVLAPQINAEYSPICSAPVSYFKYSDIYDYPEYELVFNASNPCNNCPGITYSFSVSDPSLKTTLIGNSGIEVYVPEGTPDVQGFTVSVTATCGDRSCTTSYFEPGCCSDDKGQSCAWVNPDLSADWTQLGQAVNDNPENFNHFVHDSASSDYLEDIDNISGCYALTIDGILKVDENLTIKNCDIFMSPGASIILSNGANLTIENSYLHPCSSMWDGIYVPFGTSITVENGSLLEGAENAIVSDQGSQFTIENSTLNANYIGIVVNPVNWADGGPVIEGSQISCNDYFSSLPPNNHGNNVTLSGTTRTLDAPYTNWISEMGIELNNVYSINIGSTATSGDNNLFLNQYYGIYSRASSIDIYNNTFENINFCTCPNSSILANPPSAIVAFGEPTGSYTVTIGGRGTNEPNTFNYLANGVREEDTLNLNVVNNSFLSVNSGVVFQKNFKNNVNITYNNISTSTGNSVTYGIFGDDNADCSVPIETNTITCNANYSYGVDLQQGVLNLQTGYIVNNNNIYTAEFGIFANGFQGGQIEGNNITTNGYQYSGSNEGIELDWGVGTYIHDNTVTGTSPYYGDGIRLDDAHGTTYSLTVTCNNTYHTYNGLYFSGPQMNDYIDYNNMYTYSSSGTHGGGLFLNSNGNIYVQGSATHGTDNTWNDGYISNTIPPVSIYNANPGLYVNFYVNSSVGTPGNPENTYGRRNLYSSGTDCYSCSGFPCLNTCHTCTIGLATQIIRSDISYPIYSSASHWVEKFELYSSVLANDTLYIDSTTMRLDTVVHLFIDSVVSSNMGHIYAMLGALADTNGVSMADLNTANSMLSAISSPDTVESTFKQVYQVYADMLSYGITIPGSTQLSTLQGIAEECPEQYGPAVYAARAMLAPIDTTLYVNDCELLPDSTSRDFHKPTKRVDSTATPTPPSIVNVYPNPANTQLNIQVVPLITGAQSINDYFYLYDNMGQLIGKYPLTQSLTTLGLTSVADGIYYYRIVDNNQQALKTDKLLIIR